MGMSRRYCIGCVHLQFTAGSSATQYSELTFEPSTHAQFHCKRGHWERRGLDLNDADQQDVESAMDKAQTCPDYSERPPP